MKYKTETKEALSILKSIDPIDSCYHLLPMGSLKKYPTIKEAWDNCEGPCELLLFKLLCAGPQNKKHRKTLAGKIKLIFKEIKQMMKNDIQNLPNWLKYSDDIDLGSFINKVAVMESDILQHLKYKWDTDYIYSIEYVEDAINSGMETGIVKKHLVPPTIKEIKQLLFSTVGSKNNNE